MEGLQDYSREWNGKIPMIDLSRFANVPPTVAVCHVRKIAVLLCPKNATATIVAALGAENLLPRHEPLPPDYRRLFFVRHPADRARSYWNMLQRDYAPELSAGDFLRYVREQLASPLCDEHVRRQCDMVAGWPCELWAVDAVGAVLQTRIRLNSTQVQRLPTCVEREIEALYPGDMGLYKLSISRERGETYERIDSNGCA